MKEDQNQDESVEKGLSKYEKSSVAAATSQKGGQSAAANVS